MANDRLVETFCPSTPEGTWVELLDDVELGIDVVNEISREAIHPQHTIVMRGLMAQFRMVGFVPLT